MSTTHSTPYAGIVKEVVMDAPGDYSAFVNGQYVGSRRTRVAAEELCDDRAYTLLSDGTDPTPPAAAAPYDLDDAGAEAQYVERDLPHAEFMALLDYAHSYDADPLTIDGAALAPDEASDVARLAAHVAAAYAAATEVRRAAA